MAYIELMSKQIVGDRVAVNLEALYASLCDVNYRWRCCTLLRRRWCCKQIGGRYKKAGNVDSNYNNNYNGDSFINKTS